MESDPGKFSLWHHIGGTIYYDDGGSSALSPLPAGELPMASDVEHKSIGNAPKSKADLLAQLKALCRENAELSEANRTLKKEITERTRVQNKRKRAQQRLLENSLAVHERDRQLMAYELHDGLVQDVTAALLHLEALRGKLDIADGKTGERLDMILKILRQAIVEARQVISGLRPPILDELGVVAAIAHLIDEQCEPGGPEILFVHDIKQGRMGPLLERTLFRIVQEALANIKHHSQAEKAHVQLTQEPDHVRLAVSDTGIGFDPMSVPDNRFGLQGIRKRAELLRGRARIDSAPGKGTRITVLLPISPVDR